MRTRKWKRSNPDLETAPPGSTSHKAESHTCWQTQQAAHPAGLGGSTVSGWGHRTLPSPPSASAPCPALPPCCWSLPWRSHSSADSVRSRALSLTGCLLPVWDLAPSAAPRAKGVPIWNVSVSQLMSSVLCESLLPVQPSILKQTLLSADPSGQGRGPLFLLKTGFECLKLRGKSFPSHSLSKRMIAINFQVSLGENVWNSPADWVWAVDQGPGRVGGGARQVTAGGGPTSTRGRAQDDGGIWGEL